MLRDNTAEVLNNNIPDVSSLKYTEPQNSNHFASWCFKRQKVLGNQQAQW